MRGAHCEIKPTQRGINGVFAYAALARQRSPIAEDKENIEVRDPLVALVPGRFLASVLGALFSRDTPAAAVVDDRSLSNEARPRLGGPFRSEAEQATT